MLLWQRRQRSAPFDDDLPEHIEEDRTSGNNDDGRKDKASILQDQSASAGHDNRECATHPMADAKRKPVACGGVSAALAEDSARLNGSSLAPMEVDEKFWPQGQPESPDQTEMADGAPREHMQQSRHDASEALPQACHDEMLEFVGQRALEALPHITQVLWSGSKLKSLKLNEADLGATPSSFSLLSRPLAVNHVLTQLDVSHNQIDCLAMALLATSLCHNSSIKRLSLAKNRIAANGGRHLAQALKANHGIVQLDLSHNLLGPSGSSCVAMALNFNTSLADLCIAANAVGNEAACFFAETIKRQGTLLTQGALSKLDLSNNGITGAGAEALLRALHVSSNCVPSFNPAHCLP